MPDTKITALTALTAADPANDVLPIVDVSDTTMAASGTTKKISINNLLSSSPTASGNFTITGDLTVDTSTLKVDAANNRVGIGTATPVATLIVRDGSNRNLLVATDASHLGSAGIAIGSFTDAAANYAPLSILAGTTMAFAMGGTTRMTLDSSGNLGIGTSSPGHKLDVNTTGGSAATARLIGNDQVNVRLRLENSGSGGSTWELVGGLPGVNNAFFSIRHVTGSTTPLTIDSSGNLGLGVTPTAGAGVLQLSSGINFPATQVASANANTLDDYEEGTWSPTVIAAIGTPTTVTTNSATYTKVGRLVVCSFDFSIVNIGTASSSLQFSLPFTSITSTSFCGSFRESSSTGNMGQVFYNSGTDVACLLYDNATVWVNGYRISGTYAYFAA